jgi:hypothetical protein
LLNFVDRVQQLVICTSLPTSYHPKHKQIEKVMRRKRKTLNKRFEIFVLWIECWKFVMYRDSVLSKESSSLSVTSKDHSLKLRRSPVVVLSRSVKTNKLNNNDMTNQKRKKNNLTNEMWVPKFLWLDAQFIQINTP